MWYGVYAPPPCCLGYSALVLKSNAMNLFPVFFSPSNDSICKTSLFPERPGWLYEPGLGFIYVSLASITSPAIRQRFRAYLALASGSGGNVDETTSVLLTLVGAALGRLGGFGLLDLAPQRISHHSGKRAVNSPGSPKTYLGGLRLDLARAGERSVNFAHDC